MIISSQLQDKLKGKHILVDTCVLSYVSKNVERPEVEAFFTCLQKLGCPIITNDLVKLEFLRDSLNIEQWTEKKKFIERLCANSIHIKEEMISEAVIISNLYKRHRIEGVELTDLVNSSLLRSFLVNTVIVTTNHKHYPTLIHQRVGTVVVDNEKDILLMAFYGFNDTGYTEAFDKFFIRVEEKKRK